MRVKKPLLWRDIIRVNTLELVKFVNNLFGPIYTTIFAMILFICEVCLLCSIRRRVIIFLFHLS
jgi:hypothetical protein